MSSRVAVLAAIFLTVTSMSAQAALYDDFNDNSTNHALWTAGIINAGSGVSVSETNQRLEIDLSANAAAAGGLFGGGYGSNVAFHGDLDIWVDFQLLNWPASNGVRVGLSFYDASNANNFWAVERVSAGRGEIFGDSYLTDFNHSVALSSLGSDQFGALRLARTGTTLSAYYLAGGQWQLMRSDPITSGDLIFGIAAWSHDQYFNDQAVKIAFDNVNVNAVPLPPALWLFGSAILGLMGIARVKHDHQ
jgi:hypothetical protein